MEIFSGSFGACFISIQSILKIPLFSAKLDTIIHRILRVLRKPSQEEDCSLRQSSLCQRVSKGCVLCKVAYGLLLKYDLLPLYYLYQCRALSAQTLHVASQCKINGISQQLQQIRHAARGFTLLLYIYPRTGVQQAGHLGSAHRNFAA